MKRATITLTAALLIVTGFSTSSSFADGRRHSHSHSAHGGHSGGQGGGSYQTRALIGAYFSPRLGAQFAVERVHMGGYSFVAARIVSQPVYGSPLYQLNLNVGDVITRLDGIRVTSSYELERHIQQTKVRFVRAGSSYPQNAWMFINPHRFFQDTFYPPNFPYSGGGGGTYHP